jgi:hypothetical protein
LKRNILPKPNAVDVKAALGSSGDRPEKLDRINFLVWPAEKREIQETAKAFGLTTTDYLLRLHRLTRSMMESQKGRVRTTARTASKS